MRLFIPGAQARGRRADVARGRNAVPMVGRVFDRATVLAETNRRTRSGLIIYRCLCQCRNEFDTSGSNLRRGATKSCGCLAAECAGERLKKCLMTHGHARRGRMSGAFRSWLAMKRRCLDPSFRDYHRYGGRGITMADDWLKFEHFLADMGDRPEGKTLDQIDRTGHYVAENCRWATHEEQMNNTSRTRLFTWKGKTLSISQWARRQGLPRARVSARINALGWSIERALELD
jgi:hypothetical protein